MKITTYPLILSLFLFLMGCAAGPREVPAGETPTDEGRGPATSVPMATPAETPVNQVEPTQQAESPVTEKVLEGQLYFVGFKSDRPHLLQIDLASGEEKVAFAPPEGAWLSEVAGAPNGEQLLLAYSPQPDEGQVQFGFTDLFLMPLDGELNPQPFLQRADLSETYFNISWPVPEFIYYAHLTPVADEAGTITYLSQVERARVPGGEVEVLVRSAAWPRVSRDGSMLAYVTEGNEFILAAADGSNPRLLLDPTLFTAVDAPLFTPDNQHICFSAVIPATSMAPSIWDRLFGVQVASAHSVPSDWWCMPVDGSGEPERLTTLDAIGLYGDFDIPGEHMAFVAANGVYVMNQDGSDLRMLREIPTTATIEWLP